MAFETPTTKAISDNIVAQLEATFGESMPKSFTRVLAKVLAGVFVILYKYCGFIFLQMFVSSASMRPTEINGRSVVPLVEWGRLIGAGGPGPASPAEIRVKVTAEITGASIPSGAQIVNPRTGVVYLTTESTVLESLETEIQALAVSDPNGGGGAGIIGNVRAGELLSFANPLTGAARTVTVVGTTTTGVEAETDDAYRTRVIARFQQRPQGGAYVDYRNWASEALGVKQAYAYASTNPGQVDIYVESATEPDGIPTVEQMQAVYESVNFDQEGLATRRPVGALVTINPITRKAFSVTVNGLSVENQPDVRAEIEAALSKYFEDREPYLVGLEPYQRRKDRITVTAVSGVIDDIVSAYGGIFVNVTMALGGVNTAIYTLAPGEKAKLQGVTYT